MAPRRTNTPPAPGAMTQAEVLEFLRTGSTSAPALTTDQVGGVLAGVLASNASTTPTQPVAQKTSTTSADKKKPKKPKKKKPAPAASAITKSLDQLIKDTEARMFDTSVFDTRRKYLEEQLNTAKSVKAASEEQARLQYQALSRMAQEQQAAAMGATQAGYSEALGDVAAQGAAGAAIGGGMGAALAQQMTEQELADEAALREIGATAAGGAQSAGALQELINQAYGRDLASAQARQAGAIEAEQVAAASQFEQQRMEELARMQLQRSQEVQRILDEQAAAREREAARRAAAAQSRSTADSPSANIFNTGIGRTVQSREGKTQDSVDPETGKVLTDAKGRPVQEPWGLFRTTVFDEKGVAKQEIIDSKRLGTDVMLYAGAINTLMTATTGSVASMSKEARTQAAIAQVQAMQDALLEKYGAPALQALSAPASKGGLGLPSDPVKFVKQAAQGGK